MPPITSAPEPLPPSPDEPPAPVGAVHRVGLPSLKSTRPEPGAEVLKRFNAESRPLDQAGLDKAWDEMLPQLPDDMAKVREKVSALRPELKEPDLFTLTVGNSFAEAEMRPGLIPMLNLLRTLTGRPNLNCKIEVVYEEKESVAYSPRDKYDVMSRENPTLDTFKILFPDVDY